MILLSFVVPLSAFGQDIGSSVSTDDICSARPDLCQHRPSRNRKPRRAVTEEKKRRTVQALPEKRKKVRKLKDDDANFMREFFSKEKEDSAFNDEIALDPAPARKPASVEGPSTQRKKISFSSYLNSNSNHPSLSMRYGGRQDAFQDVQRPSVLTAPSSSGVGVSDAPSEEGSGNQSVRENQPPQPSTNQGTHY
jgi:hypothetical protein